MATMTRISLGSTDMEIGRGVLGTMPLGTDVDERTSLRIIERALEAGVTMLDTANGYGKGTSEELVGRAVSGIRDQVQIATKVAVRMGPDDDQEGLSPKALHRAIDESLRRLGTDHVDVWYFHRPDPATPIEESLGAAADIVATGKVRHLAQSNYAAWQIADMHRMSRERGWAVPQISQPLYNLLARRLEDEYLGCASELGLGNIVYNPLAGGLLTGKHRLEDMSDDGPTQGTAFRRSAYRSRYWHPEHFAAVDELAVIAEDVGTSLIGLSLRWLLTRPGVDAVLLGASSVEQLDANLAVWDERPLDDETCARIDDVWVRVSAAAPPYHRWPNPLDQPAESR